MTAQGTGTAPAAPLTATIVAVALGGALGALSRWGMDLALTSSVAPAGAGTLVVNVLGSLVLGLITGAAWFALPAWLRAGIGTGFLGGFTTYSALALLAAEQLFVAPWAAALGLVLNVALGLAAAWVGVRLGQRWTAGTEAAG